MRNRDSRNKKQAQALEGYAAEKGIRLFVEELDVTRKKSVAKAVETIVGKEKRLDVVVSNAGIWGPGVLESFTMKQWRQVFDVNFFGSVRVMREVLPVMREQGHGLVLQLSSLQGRFILPYSGPYVASKWAIEAATEQFRYELASFGVEFTLLEPYDFMTEMKDKAINYVAADASRDKDYGSTVDFIKQFYLVPNQERANDPVFVIDAIQQIIDMPTGTRPVRVTVKNPLQQIETMNSLQVEMQTELFGWMNLQHMLKPAVKKT